MFVTDAPASAYANGSGCGLQCLFEFCDFRAENLRTYLTVPSVGGKEHTAPITFEIEGE